MAQKANHDGTTVLRMQLDDQQDDTVSAFYARDDEKEWDVTAQEGKLAVDVLETEGDIVVLSTLAGIDIDELEIAVRNDLLTVRGFRKSPLDDEQVKRVHYRECFWGTFSRSIVLPLDVDGPKARAVYRHGVLMIVIPKLTTQAKVPIEVIEE